MECISGTIVWVGENLLQYIENQMVTKCIPYTFTYTDKKETFKNTVHRTRKMYIGMFVV